MNDQMVRTFTTSEFMLRDDGHTVDGRIVPYGEVAHVQERTPDGIVEFDECFLEHSCAWLAQSAKQRGNASFIQFRLEHGEDFDGMVGYARSLHDKPDGAYAEFRLYDNKDLAKVQSMLRESHTGLSVFFTDRVPPRVEGGLVQRVSVNIAHVAATPMPAYQSAMITGMRSESVSTGTPNLDELNSWLATIRGEAS